MCVDLIVIGGGAAGFFGAITCAERSTKSVLILEKTSQVLQKVKISGGGRCNVTHDCVDPRELSKHYPRGDKALIGPFHRFGAADTIEWFASRNVMLKTEADGRMFPESNDSQTIVDVLVDAAHRAGVRVRTSEGVISVEKHGDRFDVLTDVGNSYTAANVLLATGGTRLAAGARIATSLGHELAPATPSLFTFRIADPRLTDLLGVAVRSADVSVHQSQLRSSGPVLITHWGLSGPGILKISSWGARELAARGYRFDISVNWLPDVDAASVLAEKWLSEGRRQLSSRSPFEAIPRRLWRRLLTAADVADDLTWAQLSKAQASRLCNELTNSAFGVVGKATNKDEFVTCGGVALTEIDFQSMGSKLVDGLYFAGEVIDVDGVTGGFNFQNAWTTGYHAGAHIAERPT